MAEKLLARIKPGKKGFVVKRYMFQGTLYVATRGWYEVSDAVADQLRKLHQDDSDEDSPKIFQVATREEAVRIEEEEAEQLERATAARPNRVVSSGAATTRQRGGDLSTADLPGNEKEPPAMLDPDPDGEELAGLPDEQEGIAPIGRVTEKEDDAKPRRRTVVGSPSSAATTPAMPAVVVPSKPKK